MNPEFPIYIPSYGRWEERPTVKVLERLGVPYNVVVEQEQYDEYAQVIDEEDLLVVPDWVKEEYDTCDDLGDVKSKGPGPARNFAWEHAIEQGYDWHWVMDDNIQGFYWFNQNRYVGVNDGAIFRAMEDFVRRYENVAMAGPRYFMFAVRKNDYPPFVPNTRVYSCNLIRNDLPYRWRGRYNEDTDLSLRMLKDGWCTIMFNAFLQDKATTQKYSGGNTERFYDREGTYPKSKMLVDLHPNVAELVIKWGRWHHQVDYTPFKNNELIKKPDADIPEGVDNYGMTWPHGQSPRDRPDAANDERWRDETSDETLDDQPDEQSDETPA